MPILNKKLKQYQANISNIKQRDYYASQKQKSDLYYIKGE